MKPIIAVILLNFNNHHYTIPCLDSLQKSDYPNLRTIIIDNGSKPESIEAIRQAHPDETLVELGENLGFTGGNNAGIRMALDEQADYVILLNNDTEVPPDMFNILVDALDADPSMAITGPVIYYHDVPDTFWSVAGSLDWPHGRSYMIGLNEVDEGQFGEDPQEADFITGCALLVRRDVWEKVGLLDDDFFIYYEETEWCVRAARAGFKIQYVPRAKLWHKISIEQRAESPWAYYYMTRNRLLFLRKTSANLQTWLNVGMEYCRTFLSWSLRPKWKERRPLRLVMLRAIRDYVGGNYGETFKR